MTMIIGTFAYDHTNDSFQGAIVTLGFDYDTIDITPTDSMGEREPDYRITASTARGGTVELGAGWKRTSGAGRAFVSVSLDGPVLPAPISAALFTDERGEASLVWNRPKPDARPRSQPAGPVPR